MRHAGAADIYGAASDLAPGVMIASWPDDPPDTARLLLAFLALPLAAQAPRLSARETRMRDWALAHRDEQIAYLARVVDIPSGTMNADGVRRVGAVFRASLDSLGFTTRWVAQDSVRRGGHLVAVAPRPCRPGAPPPHRPPGHRVRGRSVRLADRAGRFDRARRRRPRHEGRRRDHPLRAPRPGPRRRIEGCQHHRGPHR